MTAAPDRVRAVVEPLVDAAGAELFDLELAGGVLRVTIDKPGGVDLDDLTRVTRDVSRALDDEDPISGRYTLEVSSPGLERTLRTPAHFAWAVGRQVSVKAAAGFDGPRRCAGTLATVDEAGITLVLDDPPGERLTLAYDDVEKARTVVDWSPAPKPGRGTKPGKRRTAAPGSGPAHHEKNEKKANAS
ncbi:MAG: ribosome maturation factor RimP [Acidimicrobiales bacterium]